MAATFLFTLYWVVVSLAGELYTPSKTLEEEVDEELRRVLNELKHQYQVFFLTLFADTAVS